MIAVGQGKTTVFGDVVPLDLRPGDRILFGNSSGDTLKQDEGRFVFLEIDDVFGRIVGPGLGGLDLLGSFSLILPDPPGRSSPSLNGDDTLSGEVVKVGPGGFLGGGGTKPPEVKSADRVLFGKYAGTEIELDDKEYLIMREDDILGLLER